MTRHIAMMIRSAVVIALLGLGGCATTLRPAPDAERVVGRPDAAVAVDAGVKAVVVTDAWRGYPIDLDDVVSPLLVTLTNDSGRRLELRYEHAGLVTPGGVLFAAVPPFQLDGVVWQPVDGTYPAGGFAPYYSPYSYPGWSPYGAWYPYRAPYYGGFYSSLERVTLPSGDMVQKALPEGVLAPGGRVTGFLFFERVEDVRRVMFMMILVDASSGERFGEVAIPLVVERRARDRE